MGASFWRWTIAGIAAIAALLAGAGCGGDPPPPAGEDRGPAEEGRTGRPEPLLAAGDRVVVAGDSLGITGSSRPYPSLLAERIGAPLDVINLSEPGTATADWLPGSELFENVLAPALDGADLLLLTLGGNDLERALGAASGPDALAPAQSAEGAAAVAAELGRVSDRLQRIIGAARRRNPGLEVAYVSYPDYSGATVWRERLGGVGLLAFRTALGTLLDGARRAGPDATVDLLAATDGRDLDALLLDAEHLNDAGHRLYAREIARSLSRPPGERLRAARSGRQLSPGKRRQIDDQLFLEGERRHPYVVRLPTSSGSAAEPLVAAGLSA